MNSMLAPHGGNSSASNERSSSESDYDSSSSGHSSSGYSSSSSTSSSYSNQESTSIVSDLNTENENKPTKKKTNKKKAIKKDENIKVLVRIRPLVGREEKADEVVACNASAHAVEGLADRVVIDTEEHHVEATFDGVFGPESTQADIYEQVHKCVGTVMEGFNSTLFAYGQTGSGKTFTLFGPEDDRTLYTAGNDATPMTGVIPRAIRDILSECASPDPDPDTGEQDQVSVYSSFIQIYNDQVFDLLRDPHREHSLSVHEDAKGEIYIEGVSEYQVKSLRECLNLLAQGDEYRACRQTRMNDVSSRSHSVFQLLVERRKSGGRLVKSKLNLVDLAGSEKWNVLTEMGNEHVSELTNINSSLHALGRCIAALTDPKATHVPFRDSKLTRILMDALGGNARTCIIATVSPAQLCIEETISTLKFADRAMRVVQHATVNETREINLEMVESLEKEVKALRKVICELTGDKEWKTRSVMENDEEQNNELAVEEKLNSSRTTSSRFGDDDGAGVNSARNTPRVNGELVKLVDILKEVKMVVDDRDIVAETQSTRSNKSDTHDRQDNTSLPTQTVNLASNTNRISVYSPTTPEAEMPVKSANIIQPSQAEHRQYEKQQLQLGQLEQENKNLHGFVRELNSCAEQFFTFKIEEEDFEIFFKQKMSDMNRALKSNKALGTNASTSASASKATSSARRQQNISPFASPQLHSGRRCRPASAGSRRQNNNNDNNNNNKKIQNIVSSSPSSQRNSRLPPTMPAAAITRALPSRLESMNRKLRAPVRRASEPAISSVATSEPGLKFRVRGRRDSTSSEMLNASSTDQALESRLREQRARLHKNHRLQEWLASKARRELGKIDSDREAEEKHDKEQREREERWRRHAKSVKQRLARMQRDDPLSRFTHYDAGQVEEDHNDIVAQQQQLQEKQSGFNDTSGSVKATQDEQFDPVPESKICNDLQDAGVDGQGAGNHGGNSRSGSGKSKRRPRRSKSRSRNGNTGSKQQQQRRPRSGDVLSSHTSMGADSSESNQDVRPAANATRSVHSASARVPRGGVHKSQQHTASSVDKRVSDDEQDHRHEVAVSRVSCKVASNNSNNTTGATPDKQKKIFVRDVRSSGAVAPLSKSKIVYIGGGEGDGYGNHSGGSATESDEEGKQLSAAEFAGRKKSPVASAARRAYRV